MMASTPRDCNTPRAEFRKTAEASRRLLQQAAATSSRALAVLSFLDSHANGAGQAFPSHATLAAETNRSVRTVIYAIRELEAAGIIETTPGSGRTVTRYQIRYPAIDRGCSPIEYNKPRPQAAPRAPVEAEKIAIAAQSPEGIEKLAAFYQTSTTQVMIAIQRTRRRQPANFGAYLRKVLLENQRSPTLLEGRRETIMAARAELRALEAKGAVA